jgi:hypothetical protein
VGVNSEYKSGSSFCSTKSIPEDLSQAKSKKRRKGSNCRNSSSHGGVGLLGIEKERSIQGMNEDYNGYKSLVFFMIP